MMDSVLNEARVATMENSPGNTSSRCHSHHGTSMEHRSQSANLNKSSKSIRS